MGKKSKKNRFNQSVDVDIVYSSNTIAEMDPTDNLAELNLSSEKAEELQKIRAKLPTFTSTSSVESELAKLPMDKPFRAFVYNVSYLATGADVEQFFSPLRVTNINIVSGSGGSRGFCFVDFASREDLAKALERSDSSLAGRQVNVRIAAPNSSERGGFVREKHSGMRRTEVPFERRGGYKPSVLRDDGEDNESIWKRGFVSRTSDFGPSGLTLNRSQLSLDPNLRSTPPGERPKLNLLPRTVQRDSDGQISERNSKIFGEARPVDTASKNREVEQRLSAADQTSILNP
ncbi:putative RNA-binding protein [Schistosoma japonicum]|uniref:Eukaryotic translation initiation factor 4H n=1 Tax=Schistosoma japonicum TaxID=6182 RepID=Q5D9X4_SCHJA|nr:SJCHGC09499 protein [Schistosoma japonicum]KAH8874362.1 Eukaryotic translation initiation factor 4H [Schistosoma japonicum]KAH8874363.1 Eukaryotic translation initiation factor 4H [Schistosoma japonicum]KAH8874364.1 Eukaryotic translation initiation factor 4H [Schistosoma japonicum]TNN21096.1 putative RNA-binding protein [Schistosoma japonicum]